MIGFITDKPTADSILAQIKQAQTSRGWPYYWSTGSYNIYSGPYAGGVFIPTNEQILNTPLRKNQTPQDFPECQQLIEAMGGLDARVEIDPEALKDPNLPDILNT